METDARPMPPAPTDAAPPTDMTLAGGPADGPVVPVSDMAPPRLDVSPSPDLAVGAARSRAYLVPGGTTSASASYRMVRNASPRGGRVMQSTNYRLIRGGVPGLQ